MAVVTPIKNDSGNIKLMSSAEVTDIVNQAVYQYSLNPSVTLSVVGSGGTLGSMTLDKQQVLYLILLHLFQTRQQQQNQAK